MISTSVRSAVLAGLAIAAFAQTPPPVPPAPPTPPAPAQAAAQAAAQAMAALKLAGGGSFLGVNVSEVDENRAKELKLREERGVEITKVEEDTPAEKAGLKKGDVVTEYNGQRVEGTEQFVRLVRETPAGRTVRLGIFRNGASQTLTATIGTRKLTSGKRVITRGGDGSFEIHLPEFQFTMPDIPHAVMSMRSQILGVEAEQLKDQLAQYFGVKEGVLVRSVIKDTAAEKAGIKAGDVITKVDGKEVATTRDLTSAIRTNRAKKTFPITLVRDKRETTVNVTMEDDRGGALRPGPVRRVVNRQQEFEF